MLVLIWWSVIIGVVGCTVVVLASWRRWAMRITCTWGWLVVVGVIATTAAAAAGIMGLRITTL